MPDQIHRSGEDRLTVFADDEPDKRERKPGMGVDIHTYVEQQTEGGRWERLPNCEVFDWRNYELYGWLADVRNYAVVPPISQPRGLPDDLSDGVLAEWDWSDGYSASWLSVDELLSYDYDASFEDRRVTRGGSGRVTAEPGGGKVTTYREMLGQGYFEDLEALRRLGERPTRVVFWFA